MTEQFVQQGHMKLGHMITLNLKRLKARNYISWYDCKFQRYKPYTFTFPVLLSDQ
jgi:hypothetical protein